MHLRSLLITAFALVLAACSSSSNRKLPAYEKPIARSRFQNVRTTAYTHTESDHLAYGNKSALGTPLRTGQINSAAADWARWPAGTVFRICSTGELYQVDDYGWALTGRNTIDLYKPSRRSMNAWGLRYEKIEVIRWGDPWASYRKMKPVAKYEHIAQMMRDIRRFYGSPSSTPAPQPSIVAVSATPPRVVGVQ
jgi:3D (Asp-Asp-Asp) domain-containing protein